MVDMSTFFVFGVPSVTGQAPCRSPPTHASVVATLKLPLYESSNNRKYHNGDLVIMDLFAPLKVSEPNYLETMYRA